MDWEDAAAGDPPLEGHAPTLALGGAGDAGHVTTLHHPRLLTRRALSARRKNSVVRPSVNVRVVMRADTAGAQEWIDPLPRSGERIELLLPRLGIRPRGTVFYADHLQVLVKWDDGRSESLRPRPADRFRIVEDTPPR